MAANCATKETVVEDPALEELEMEEGEVPPYDDHGDDVGAMYDDYDDYDDDEPFDDDLLEDELEPLAPFSSTNPLSYSLASSPNTPLWAKLLIPVLCLGCHAIFYYGQTAPMWKLRAFVDIDAWANATDVSAQCCLVSLGRERKTRGPPSHFCFF